MSKGLIVQSQSLRGLATKIRDKQRQGYQVYDLYSSGIYFISYFCSMVPAPQDPSLEQVRKELHQKTQSVMEAMNAQQGGFSGPTFEGVSPMAGKSIDGVIQEIKDTEGVLDSVVVFVNAVPGRIKAAADAVLAGGVVTAEQLAPVFAEADLLAAKSKAVVDAIAANAPAPPPA